MSFFSFFALPILFFSFFDFEHNLDIYATPWRRDRADKD